MSVGDARLASEGELVFGLALYLAMNAGAEVSRDAVAHLLWPSHGTDAARHCLRQLVYRLRALGVPLAPSGDTVDLPADRVIVDAHTLFAGEPSRQAYLQIERFDVLPDYAPTFSKPFSLWLEQVREQLCVKLRHGLMACIADARARGRYREVSQLATHCLSLDPLNEEATLGLAEAAALAGNKVRALRILDDYRADLGASPTLTLQTDILRRRIAERLNVYGAQPDDVPMVGREDAVEYLLRGLHAMSSGVPQQLLIIGEPGVGKTRLLSEFQKIAAVHGVRPVVLRCHPGWDDQPLTAITELASTLLQLPGALGCSPDAMLALRELTSGTTRRSDSALYATDGEAVLANLRWAVLDLVEAVMQERHLVLMIDNLQWLDPLSESFLTYIIPRCHAKPLYVILTMREEDERRDGKGRHPLAMIEHRMTLAPLDDTSARQLVHEVLDLVARSLSEAAIHACIRRCGGNPYFLSELTKFLLVAGPDAAAPVTLRTFIEFRLGKVSRSARRALQAVGILGRFATAERIRRILQSSGRRLMDSLEELQIAGLVQVTNNRCECRHDVVREIVVGGMSGVARRVLHLRAAREFKRDAQTTDSPTLLLECGRHLLLSGDTVRAPRGALFLARRLHELGAAEHAEELARSAFDRTSEKTTRSMGLLVVARALRAQGKWRALAELRELLLSQSFRALASDSRTEILIHTAEAIVQLGAFAETDLMYLVQLSEDTSLSWKPRLLAARLAATVMPQQMESCARPAH
ncbi:MAG: AAA family ATPase [Gemmatimonadaceae bacterium]